MPPRLPPARSRCRFRVRRIGLATVLDPGVGGSGDFERNISGGALRDRACGRSGDSGSGTFALRAGCSGCLPPRLPSARSRCRSGSPDRSGEGVEYSGMNGLCRAETASVGTIFCWIGGTQIANKLKIWSSLRFKATDGELAPDWIASETLGISTMRSAGW